MKHLKGVRPQISQAIAEARELGDLKENAEYHAAREQQGMVEARIRDIEAKLSNAQVIDVTAIPHSGKGDLRHHRRHRQCRDRQTVTYQIVGDDEADISGKISVNSPIARALIGKTEGDAVLVRTPGGDVEYEIVEVRHI